MIPKLKLITYDEHFDDLQFKDQEDAFKLECAERKKLKLGKHWYRNIWANIYTSKDNIEKENK